MSTFYLCETAEEKNVYYLSGTSFTLNKKISKLEKKVLMTDRKIKISTDFNIANDFKLKLRSQPDIIIKKNHLVKIADRSNNNNDNMFTIVLNTFFESHRCDVRHVQVCQKCLVIINKKDKRIIGRVLNGESFVFESLHTDYNWVCDKCRMPYAFSLIAWSSNTCDKSNYNYIAIASKRNFIQKKFNEIRRNFTEATVIISIYPSFREKEISNGIKQKLLISRPQHLSQERVSFYKKIVLQSFLKYFVVIDENKEKNVRFCQKCNHLFLKKGQKDLGYIFSAADNVCNLLDLTPNWFCSHCQVPSLVIYAMETHEKTIDYYISSEKEGGKKGLDIGNIEKRYVHSYPLLKLFHSCAKGDLIKILISKMQKVSMHKNTLKTDMSKSDLIDSVRRAYRRIQFNQIFNCTRTCEVCQCSVDPFGKDYGFFWAEGSDIVNCKNKQPYIFLCSRHKIDNIMFCDKTTFNSVNQMDSVIVNLFSSTDIVCLYGNQETGRCIQIQPNFFFDRLIITDTGVNTGCTENNALMVLIKRNISFNYEQLSFSDRGLFVKIKTALDCYIIGVVDWPKSEEETSENITGLLRDLKLLISTHNNSNVKFIVGGNFNCHVGNLNNFEDETIFWNGQLYMERRSSDITEDTCGQKLAELMKRNNFILCNGRTISDYPGKSTINAEKCGLVTDLVWVSSNLAQRIKDLKLLNLCPKVMKSHKGLLLELNLTNSFIW